jgi:hypothetical protein
LTTIESTPTKSELIYEHQRSCYLLNAAVFQMGDEGLEPRDKSSANMVVASTGAAKSAAVDAELAFILAAWPTLNFHARCAMAAIARETMDTTVRDPS